MPSMDYVHQLSHLDGMPEAVDKLERRQATRRRSPRRSSSSSRGCTSTAA